MDARNRITDELDTMMPFGVDVNERVKYIAFILEPVTVCFILSWPCSFDGVITDHFRKKSLDAEVNNFSKCLIDCYIIIVSVRIICLLSMRLLAVTYISVTFVAC